jgi:hypothetical protein
MDREAGSNDIAFSDLLLCESLEPPNKHSPLLAAKMERASKPAKE